MKRREHAGFGRKWRDTGTHQCEGSRDRVGRSEVAREAPINSRPGGTGQTPPHSEKSNTEVTSLLRHDMLMYWIGRMVELCEDSFVKYTRNWVKYWIDRRPLGWVRVSRNRLQIGWNLCVGCSRRQLKKRDPSILTTISFASCRKTRIGIISGNV